LLVRAGAARVLPIAPADAQAPQIRLARQFSMGYLQLDVMEHQGLVEEPARALGLPVKVSWLTFRR
jgi:NitT/TauT family transport system substrate-binding protein